MLPAYLKALPEASGGDIDEIDRNVVAAVRKRNADVADDRRRRIAVWVRQAFKRRLAECVELDVAQFKTVDSLKVERAQVVLRVRRPDGHVLHVQRRAVHKPHLGPFAADDVYARSVCRQGLGPKVEDDSVRLHALRPSDDMAPLASHLERAVHVANHHRRARTAIVEIVHRVKPIEPREQE